MHDFDFLMQLYALTGTIVYSTKFINHGKANQELIVATSITDMPQGNFIETA